MANNSSKKLSILGYEVDIRRFLNGDNKYRVVPIMGMTNLAATDRHAQKPLVVLTDAAKAEGQWGMGKEFTAEAAEADIRKVAAGVAFAGCKYVLDFGHSNWLRTGKLGFMPEGQSIVRSCGCNMDEFRKRKGLKFDLYKGLNFRPSMPWDEFDGCRVAIVPDDTYTTMCDNLYVGKDGSVVLRNSEVSGDNSDGTAICDPSMAPAAAKHLGFFQFVGEPALKGAVRILNKSCWAGVVVEDPLFGGELELTEYDMLVPVSVFKCAPGYKHNWTGFKEWRNTARACWMAPSSKKAKLNWQGMQSLLLSGDELRALAANAADDFADWRNDKSFNGMNMRAVKDAVSQMTDLDTISPKLVSEKISFLARAKAKNLRAGRWMQPDHMARRVYICGETAWERMGLAPNEVCINSMPQGPVALLRNPHVSAFEWVLVNNRHHRNGARAVCVLPRNSVLWACLSGADGDGDQVIATADPIIVRRVQAITGGRNLPITFDSPSPTKGDLVRATVGELTNTAYQNACNTAGKFYWNFGQNPACTKLVLEAGVLCSATTMVGVDAGKYQYTIPGEWLTRWEAIAGELQQLSGTDPRYIKKLQNLGMSPAHLFQHTKLERDGYVYPVEEWKPYGGKTGMFRGAVATAKGYAGVIGKTKNGVVFEMDASRVVFDTVKRDAKGNAIGELRLSVRGSRADVIEANWEVVLQCWQEAKNRKANNLVEAGCDEEEAED